jgi:hypothetical protein
MPSGSENNQQARPGLILGLGALVVLAVVAALLLKPASDKSQRSAEGDSTSNASDSADSSATQQYGASGMRLIQKTGAGNKRVASSEESLDETPQEEVELDSAFQESLKNPVAVKRDEGLTSLADQFAQSDPDLAVAMIKEGWEDGARNKGPVLHFARDFATAYAKVDPEAAAGLLDKMPAEVQFQYGASVGAEWANSDPSSATQWAMDMEDVQLRNGMITSISGSVERAANPAHIDAWANTMIQSPIAMEFAGQVARTWSMSNVGATMQWLDSFEDSTRRAIAYQEMATSMAGRDYLDAAHWISQFPEQMGIRDQAVDSVSYTWSKTDYAAAKGWAESMGRTLLNSDMSSGSSVTSGP